MQRLSDLDDDELALLADNDFQDTIQAEARDRVETALGVYDDVMNTSDDDQARIKAADKIIALSGFKEKQSQTALPSGVSAEVFQIAMAGLAQLAGIAKASNGIDAILRDVTPARSDPRKAIEISAPDDSPMNRKVPSELLDDNDAIVNLIAGERYEIIDRTRD